MVSENSSSLLRASLLFFLASLMLGSAAMYVQFGIVFVLVIFSYKWTGLRDTIPAIISVGKPAWVMLLLFAGLFAITLGLSETVSMVEMGELKWLSFPLIFALALQPLSHGAKFGPIEKVAITILFAVSLFSMVDSIYQVVTEKNIFRLLLFEKAPIGSRRGAGLLNNPIPFAHVQGSLFFIGIIGAVSSYSIGKRLHAIALAGVSLVFFIGVLTSFARGAWLAIALTAIFSVFIMPKALRKINLIGLGIASIVGIGVLAYKNSILTRLLSAFDPAMSSNSIRLQLWRCNLEILGEHPFGIGFNANDMLVPAKLAELGYPASSFRSHPHNEFIDYAVATGFPGLLLYLGVTIWFLSFTLKMLRRANLASLKPEVFLLTSSALIQSFLNWCALTDQFTTPGRFLISLAWAVPLAIAVKYRKHPQLLVAEDGL